MRSSSARSQFAAASGLVASLIVVAALSGCAPSAAPSAKPTPTASARIGLPAGVTPAAVPTDVPNSVELRKDAALTTCTGSAGKWQASGTMANPSKDAAKYTITVFFTTPTATVIDTAVTTVSVPAGRTVKWTAEKSFTTGGHLNCVLRGVG